MGDEVFAQLEAADRLLNFIASGPNLTGEGIERLTSDRLRVLFMSDTNANDHALRHAASAKSKSIRPRRQTGARRMRGARWGKLRTLRDLRHDVIGP